MQPSRYSTPPPTSTASAAFSISRERYYKHSGKAPASGLLLMLVIGGVMAVIGATLYMLGRIYIPYDIVCLVLVVLLGLLIGISCGQAALWGQVRNPLAAAAVAVVCGMIGLYAAWVIWIWHLSSGQWVFAPEHILAAMREIAKEGVWSVRDITPTGVWLYLVWVGEAGIVLVLAAVLAYGRVASVPFCERTGKWLFDVVRVGPFEPPADPEGLKRALETGDTSALKSLRPITITHPEQYLEVQLRRSTMLHLLSVKLVRVATSNGQTVKKEQPIVDHLIVDATAWEQVRNINPAAG